MRRRLKKLALLLGAIAVCALLTISARRQEPSYKGRKLSAWLPALRYNKSMEERTEDVQALLHMGTNGLSCLAEWAGYTPPKWHDRVIRIWYDHPGVIPSRVMVWLAKDGEKAQQVPLAFAILGTNAYPALPRLNRIAAETQDQDTRERVAECTYQILYGSSPWQHPPVGPERLSALEQEAFHHANPVIRQAATNAHQHLWMYQSLPNTNSTSAAP
ncbi:MAG TPA: hypothetical protein VHP11_12475 [Tepidisphaeraceae bacterium]|nr:hypothetical protein [Tepidisphaeraceae bacterium]